MGEVRVDFRTVEGCHRLYVKTLCKEEKMLRRKADDVNTTTTIGLTVITNRDMIAQKPPNTNKVFITAKFVRS